MISAYPKIHSVGKPEVLGIFDGPVEITEKIDGSQFAFGVINDQLFMRSKGTMINIESPEGMFIEAVNYVLSIKDRLLKLPGKVFYCEYLKKPKHNTLAYSRVPQNHLMLWAVHDLLSNEYYQEVYLKILANELGIEYLPSVTTHISTADDLLAYMDKTSILGGCKAEGIVIKNYSQESRRGDGGFSPIAAAKYVSEEFKEVHKARWSAEETGQGKLDTLYQSYRVPARWMKAVQALRDAGNLTQSPKDIGALILQVQKDIQEECEQEVKEMLWKLLSKDLLRVAVHGLPEWYKEYLLKQSFEE